MQIREQAPEISAQFEKLGTLLFGQDEFLEVVRPIEGTRSDSGGAAHPQASIAELQKQHSSEKHAREITKRVEWYLKFKDPAYLRAAEQQASMAYEMFCDDRSPLPKAYPGALPKTEAGKLFPDFYFGGAKLMHAFALLGKGLGQ